MNRPIYRLTVLAVLGLAAGALATVTVLQRRVARNSSSSAPTIRAVPEPVTDTAPTTAGSPGVPTEANIVADPGIGQAGRRVFIDPATGRPGPPPPQALLQAVPAATDPLSTSSQGLRERAGTSPAGGVTVDLQGRFRSTISATVKPDGTVALQCGPGGGPCARADCLQHAPQPPQKLDQPK